MSNITFLYSWSSDDKTAWSGTPAALLKALKNKTNLRTLQVARNPKTRLGAAARMLFLPKRDFHTAQRVLDQDYSKNADTHYFSFGEYTSSAVGRTYCYQDLSVDFLLRHLKNETSGYRYLPPWQRWLFLVGLRAKRKNAVAFYRDCGGVFTMSEWLREDLIQNTGLSPDKVHHVGGGCSIDSALIQDTPKNGNKFLFVGKDFKRKNGELVVAAFKELQKKFPEKKVELYIAGPTESPKSIKGQKGITFLGRLSHEELAAWYNLCDYFVMPSRFEAYGLVFAEALTFSLPCIGKNCFAMPEFIEDGKNGYLIEKDDVQELAAAMEKLLLNGRQMAEQLKENREYYLKTYSWDTVAERILKIMEAK